MAYTVNWIAKVISIPSSDLELVSGTRYRLNMSDFLSEIRRLEADPDGGLWADQILNHTNGKQNFAGADYAPFDEIINGYTVQFTGLATRVDLVGSNNNLVDVLVATGVSVVPGNSAGLQTVNVAGGSGATAAEVWAYGSRTLTTAFPSVPTAEQNAAATIAALIEGGLTLQDVLRIVLAVTSGDATGLEGSSMVFKSLDGTKNRVEASYASGTRNVTVVDPS